MWQVVKSLRPDPSSVGQARSFCTRRLTSVLEGRGDYTEAIADAAAITAELVTNAVTAGSSAIELLIGLNNATVRIEVIDDADGTVASAAEHSKDSGLQKVAALSRDWGVTSDHGTKKVWAELDLA